MVMVMVMVMVAVELGSRVRNAAPCAFTQHDHTRDQNRVSRSSCRQGLCGARRLHAAQQQSDGEEGGGGCVHGECDVGCEV
jgi:hypothetical protein